ncbi:MAG: hypothetical protein JXR36_15320 [Bacteroidales bacterium]|nr:hypothetical protein [Bacteroidales bacterium]
MKKILFIVIAIFFAQSVLFAQCNPDLNYTDPGFYPDTITNIPPAVVGEAYSTVINAVIPTEVELQGYTLVVDSVRVFSILNLPSNLTYTVNTNSGFWLANTNGCFTIEGLPGVESIGLNELEIVLDYRITFFGMAYEVPDTLKGYKLIVSNEPISAVTKYGEESSTSDNFVGENGNVSNTPSISSSGKIFQFPTVQTISIGNITTNSATFNGSIVDNGGLSILQSGFCWNTVSNPTIADQIHTGYYQDGVYSANITELDYNTEYFVKAYAENAKGVSYGDEVSFMTLAGDLPIVSSTPISNITTTSAISGGTVTSDGGLPATARGVYWNTSLNPTIVNSHTTDGAGIGIFSSSITGLIPGTTYYLRAYVTNSQGTSYGNQLSFTTISPCAGVSPPVGYGIVSSSGKCWLDRNLGASNIASSSTDVNSFGYIYQWGRATDGHQEITSVTTTTLSSVNTPGHSDFILAPDEPFDWLINQNDNLWQGVYGINNPCPSGWRIPTASEWEEERLSWNSNNSVGAFNSPLKLPMTYYRQGPNGLLFTGGGSGNYWSSTINESAIYVNSLRFTTGSSSIDGWRRADGRAVRCIKD